MKSRNKKLRLKKYPGGGEVKSTTTSQQATEAPQQAPPNPVTAAQQPLPTKNGFLVDPNSFYFEDDSVPELEFIQKNPVPGASAKANVYRQFALEGAKKGLTKEAVNADINRYYELTSPSNMLLDTFQESRQAASSFVEQGVNNIFNPTKNKTASKFENIKPEPLPKPTNPTPPRTGINKFLMEGSFRYGTKSLDPPTEESEILKMTLADLQKFNASPVLIENTKREYYNSLLPKFFTPSDKTKVQINSATAAYPDAQKILDKTYDDVKKANLLNTPGGKSIKKQKDAQLTDLGLQTEYNYGVQELYVPNIPKGNAGEIVGSIGSTTATGAKVGKMFGPTGALVGAGVGAVAGGIQQLFAGAERKKLRRQAQQAEDINEGIAAQRSEFGNILEAQPELYAKQGMRLGMPERIIEIEGNEMVLEEVELTPSKGQIKKNFRLKHDFPKGRTHEEGGIIYKATAGDVIIPANMREKAKAALEARNYLLLEQYISKLPTDGEYAKKGYRMGAKRIYEKGGMIPKYVDGGGVPTMFGDVDENLANAFLNNKPAPNTLAAGFGEDPMAQTKNALSEIKPEGFDYGNLTQALNLAGPLLNVFTPRADELTPARLPTAPRLDRINTAPELNREAYRTAHAVAQVANQYSTNQGRQAMLQRVNTRLGDQRRQNRLTDVMANNQLANQERMMQFQQDNNQARLNQQAQQDNLESRQNVANIRTSGIGQVGNTLLQMRNENLNREYTQRGDAMRLGIFDILGRYADLDLAKNSVALKRFNS